MPITGGASPPSRVPPHQIAMVSALLYAACVLGDLWLSGSRRAFGYLSSDAFYYLVVARHVVHDGRFAFDGLHATNGFHPLWQLLLVPLTAVVEALGGAPHRTATGAIVLCAGFVALALFLTGRAFARSNGSPTIFYLWAPMGAYGLTMLPTWWHTYGAASAKGSRADVDFLYGTLWSYANGMESGVVLLAYGLIAWSSCHSEPFERRADARILGVLLAALTLARLDHVFVALSILAFTLVRTRSRGGRVDLVVAFSLPVAAYVLINWIGFGHPMPVSGGLKSSFPHVSRPNLDRLWLCLRHPAKQSYYRLYRMQQIVVPLVGALSWLATTLRMRGRRPFIELRPSITRFEWLLTATAPGVLGLALYDLLFVELSLHGAWYFPLSTFYLSLVVLAWLSKWRGWAAIERSRLVWPTLALATVATVFMFTRVHRFVGVGRRYADFYFDEAPRVQAHYRSRPPHFLENDDGIVSFSTGFPALAGMGLALDPEAAHAWVNGGIVPLALARGFDRVTSLAYWKDSGIITPSSTSDEVRAFLLSKLSIPDPGRYVYSVDYQSGDFTIIKVAEPGAARAPDPAHER